MAKYCNLCGKQLVGKAPCACKGGSSILNVFPNEIRPCEGEEKVKAYHVSRIRSKFLRLVVAEGVLTVTTKRVIYRTVSIGARTDFIHSEVPIEDISGVSLSKGRFFDIMSFFWNYFVGGWLIAMLTIVPKGIGAFIAMSAKNFDIAAPVSKVVRFIEIALIIFFIVKHMIDSKKMGVVNSKNIFFQYKNAFFQYLQELLWPIKRPLMLKIISKGGSQGPIDIALPKKFGVIDISSDTNPTETVANVVGEIGSIINNIQKYGNAEGGIQNSESYD